MEFVHCNNDVSFDLIFNQLIKTNDLNRVSFIKVGNYYKPIILMNQGLAFKIYRWFQNFFCSRREKVVLEIFAFLNKNIEFAAKKGLAVKELGWAILSQVGGGGSNKTIQRVFKETIFSINSVNEEIYKSDYDIQSRHKKLEDKSKEIDEKLAQANSEAANIVKNANVHSEQTKENAAKLIAEAEALKEKIHNDIDRLQSAKKSEIDTTFDLSKSKALEEIAGIDTKIFHLHIDLSKQALDLDITCKNGKVIQANLAKLKKEIPFFNNNDNLVPLNDALGGLDEDEKEGENVVKKYKVTFGKNKQIADFSEKSVQSLLYYVEDVIFIKENMTRSLNLIIDKFRRSMTEIDSILKPVCQKVISSSADHDLYGTVQHHLKEMLILQDEKQIKEPLVKFFNKITELKEKIEKASLSNLSLEIENLAKDTDVFKTDCMIHVGITFSQPLCKSSIDPQSLLRLKACIAECTSLASLNKPKNTTPLNNKYDNAAEFNELLNLSRYLSYDNFASALEDRFDAKDMSFDELLNLMTHEKPVSEKVFSRICQGAENNIKELLSHARFNEIHISYLLHLLKSDMQIAEENLLLAIVENFQIKAIANNRTVQEIFDEKFNGERILDYIRFEHVPKATFEKIKANLPLPDQKTWDDFFNKKVVRNIRPLRLNLFTLNVINDKKADISFKIPVDNIVGMLQKPVAHQHVQNFAFANTNWNIIYGTTTTQQNKIYVTINRKLPCPNFDYKFQLGNILLDSVKNENPKKLLHKFVQLSTTKQAYVYYTSEQMLLNADKQGFINFKCEINLDKHN
ncbi:MAG: hypothetical protein H0W88_09760 [Parachlamydiaceae bacterium]|nr:hypothetical protein [Parachlamydiaceae bacterium]